ncbi:hypothetical protein LXL04_001594 [Taraxacum kok-saghyz]
MVRPLLSFPKSRSRRSNPTKFTHQSYSFSGNSLGSISRKPPLRRGRFSAPASMRTSPANIGIILTSETVSPAKSTASENTMEELHAAIQGAIAHCRIKGNVNRQIYPHLKDRLVVVVAGRRRSPVADDGGGCNSHQGSNNVEIWIQHTTGEIEKEEPRCKKGVRLVGVFKTGYPEIRISRNFG